MTTMQKTLIMTIFTSRLDIDYLDVDFLTDVLDVVEELTRTTEKFADRQEVTGGIRLDGKLLLVSIKTHSLTYLRKTVG